ncbi:unnamed protein product [Mortierella alpina]
MGLAPALIKNIHSYGIKIPTTFQQRAIPAILSGCDVVVQDPSSSGKTSAICISAIQRVLQFGSTTGQVLIVVPTREKALQVILQDLCSGMDIHSYATRTAMMAREDLAHIAESKPRVLVGMPGQVRLAQLRGALAVEQDVRMVILDEVEEMLSRGFADPVGELLASLGPGTQVVLVLRTMTPAVAVLMAKLRTGHVQIVAGHEDLESESEA